MATRQSKTTVARSLKICLVTPDIIDWGPRTETAAAMTGIAQSLSSAGHNVTVLWVPDPGKVDAHSETTLKNHFYDKSLITLEVLLHRKELLPYLGYPQKKSAAAYYELKDRDFDVVLFALEGGLGYYTLIARDLGLIQPRPEFIVVALSPLQWLSEADHFFLSHLDHLSAHHMEKTSVELADRVICATDDLHNWFKQNGWNATGKTFVLPPPLPREWCISPVAAGNRSPNDELHEVVLLAGPNYREGLTLACDTLDELALSGPANIKVTGFGWFGQILGEHTGGMLLRRSRRWPLKLQLFPQGSVRQILEYCAARKVVAFIPGLDCAWGFWAAACLHAGIPFVATDRSLAGTAIPPARRGPAAPRGDAWDMAARLVAGTVIAEPVPGSAAERKKRDAWSQQADLWKRKPAERPKVRKNEPLVSIIVAHYDRPQYLLQAIAAIEAQTYKKIEVVVVDDGSKLPETHRVLERLERSFSPRGWKIVRQKNKYLGAARNAGIKASTGEYVLFCDDDNALFRDAVRKYVQAIEWSGADVCTAFHKVFYEDSVPLSEQLNKVHYLALGGSLDLGLILDSFGDAGAIVRRSTFQKIGYQNEEYGCTVQDWEFFARTVLAGLKLRVIPEPLYWYRSSTQSMYRTSHWYKNRQPIIAAYAKAGFRGLELFHHLAIAQFSPESEINGLRENLRQSESDRRYLRLSEIDPNTDEAIELLASIAASEGRSETAIVLLGALDHKPFRPTATERLSTEPVQASAYRSLLVGLRTSHPVTLDDMRRFESASLMNVDLVPLNYVEEPDWFFLQSDARDVSLSVLPACCPPGTCGASATITLRGELVRPALALILLLPFHADVAAAVASAHLSTEAGDGGWVSVSLTNNPIHVAVELPAPSERPLNLVVAVKPQHDTDGKALVCFSKLEITTSKEDVARRRPRLNAPPDRQRSRSLGHDEYSKAKLLSNVQSSLPTLMLAPNQMGIFLRPSEQGPVVAVMAGVFPAFARGVTGRVEVAHDEAGPFEFAVAIVEPSNQSKWVDGQPVGSLAFSGWITVEEKFKLYDVHARLTRLSKFSLDVLIAIRLPAGSSSSPANSFWRQFILVWDE